MHPAVAIITDMVFGFTCALRSITRIRNERDYFSKVFSFARYLSKNQVSTEQCRWNELPLNVELPLSSRDWSASWEESAG